MDFPAFKHQPPFFCDSKEMNRGKWVFSAFPSGGSTSRCLGLQVAELLPLLLSAQSRCSFPTEPFPHTQTLGLDGHPNLCHHQGLAQDATLSLAPDAYTHCTSPLINGTICCKKTSPASDSLQAPSDEKEKPFHLFSGFPTLCFPLPSKFYFLCESAWTPGPKSTHP